MIDRNWITIPPGPFLMGSDPRDAAPPFANERPLHSVELPAFRIGRVPVTNAQYHAFIDATANALPGNWEGGKPAAGSENLPVTYVTWHDALAFCAWAGVRLPAEAEWEKAARGPATSLQPVRDETRWWPWGDTLPDREHCHFNGQAQDIPPAAQGVVPVGQFPVGASPYGVLDLAGNVWEWTHSRYCRYPYRSDDGREDEETPGPRAVRGGSFNHDLRHIRCAARDGMATGVRDVYIGFRVVADPGDTPRIPLDLVEIPAGPFWMGSDPASRQGFVLPSEMPQHRLQLAGFRMSQTPVTNDEFLQFVRETGYPAPPHWLSADVPAGMGRHPVTHVDWHDARAYCDWAGRRLPTEAEWERAAAGPTTENGARIYPWGDEQPGRIRLNVRRDGKRMTTTPVDRYPRGATPDGILDMAGNVWEWTSTHYGPYPYEVGDGREDQRVPAARVLRGGSFLSPGAAYVRCAMRSLSFETRRREHIGFRIAQDSIEG